MKRPPSIRHIFRRLTELEVLVRQLEACHVSLAEHEQARNFSAAMAEYNRAEIARLRARIGELSNTDPPPPGALPAR